MGRWERRAEFAKSLCASPFKRDLSICTTFPIYLARQYPLYLIISEMFRRFWLRKRLRNLFSIKTSKIIKFSNIVILAV
jgi:hypothetical protein